MMIRRYSGILLLLLTTHLSSRAQRGRPDEPKQDSVIADTVVVGEEQAEETTHADTSYFSAPETSRPAAEESPILRHLPDTLVYRLQHEAKYAYANDPDYWKVHRERPGALRRWLNGVLASEGFRYTVLILLGLLLLYAIVRIVMENNLGAFYRRGRRIKGTGGETEGLPEQEDIDQQLRHYLTIGDKRQATRYLYLKALHLLSERNLIRLHADATNQEYLNQVSGSPQGPAFRFLTGAYERVWYGDFVLSESSFHRLHEYFLNFFKTLGA